MDLIPNTLLSAALAARERLSSLARTTASANAVPGSPGTEGTMAQAARTAIFVDALTSAMHARLEELKTVAK
jgi:hypothetical protein